MKVSRQADLRRNQKERTRAAIVEAALGLLRQGMMPTVASAAEAAKVSRATAYRYFPTHEALLSEVTTITPSLEPVEAALRSMSSPVPRERLDFLLDVMNPTVIENECEYRAALRLYLETWFDTRRDRDAMPKVRAGRRMRWLEQVLRPLRDQMPPSSLRRLKNALALTLGIDSIVIMKDVCAVDDEEALQVLRWTARVILEGALREAAERKRPARRRGKLR